MLVVHALWRNGRLGLWAEDSTLPTHPTSDHHPFAHPLSAETVHLRLPTLDGRPADSPELVRPDPPAPGPLTLQPWRVPIAWPADPLATLITLGADPTRILRDCCAPDNNNPTRFADQPVVLGADTRHLLAVADFAQDLVRRGRLLPWLIPTEAPATPNAENPTSLAAPDAENPASSDKIAASSRKKRPPAKRITPLPRTGGDLAVDGKSGGDLAAEGDKESGSGAPGSAAPGERRGVWRAVLTGADAGWAKALAQAQPAASRGADGGSTVPSALDDLVTAAAGEALRSKGIDDQAWLRELKGTTADLQRELKGWQRDAQGSAIRAGFRLEEPTDTDPLWRIEFALQSVNEVIPAHRVWKGRKLPARLTAPKQTLLAELGRATRLYPELAGSLGTPEPEEMKLDAAQAHHFLSQAAPLLHTAGFGVMLPKWWGKPSSRLGVQLKAKSRTAPGIVAGKSAVGLDSLVDYSWELSLGDEPLSEAELTELADLKTPLVRLRGKWVELDHKRLANGLKLLRDGGQMSVAELLHAALAGEDGPAGLEVTQVSATGPLGDLLSGAQLTLIDPPNEFVGQLRPYQQRGLSWLAFLQSLGLGAILADDMGLGKTVQLLALIADPDSGRTLLICPMSLVGNWQREAARFAPKLRVHVHHGADRQLDPEADLIITTYALAARDLALLKEVHWERIVVDEAQAIKNAATRQAVAIRALPTRHRIAVTGTPVENRLADLWSLMEFANPGLLGPASSFKKSYAVPVERHGDAEAAERLKKITGPFILRRLKTDKSIISDLPDKLEMEVLCNLTAEQAALYQAVVTDMMDRIENSSGMERRGLVLATMTKLKQVCNHPAQFLGDGSSLTGRSGKLARLEEILEEVIAADEKALLFTQYASFGGMLRAHLSARFGREVLYLHGGVSRTERNALVSRFQAGSASLFVLSLKAGGTGLTLTEANHVVHVDRWWNPAVEDQATDRAFRIGQRRNVQVRKFVCAGTVEEKIAAMITDKRGLAARIVGTGELALSELSTPELRSLFALSPEAVSE